MSDNEADFTAYDALFDPARQAPAEDPTRADLATYDEWLESRDCPLHGPTRVVEAGEVPSMLGYGSEGWERQECGCSLTWDPFTGAEVWTPPRV